MDSTGPDPPQQQPQQQSQQKHQPQQQPPPQQQQQQQQQQQPQQQPQQPKPQQANQQLPHQHTHPAAQSSPYQPMHYPAPNQWIHRYPTHAYTPYYPPPHQYAYPAWNPQSATYPQAPAQSLPSMVNTQPPTNVPQQHKPVPQIISTALNADRTHNQQTLQPVPNQAATVSKVRERKPAVLKDPTTNKEVPLPNTTSSSTESSTSTSKQSPNASTANTTTTSVEHVHTLLKKVSEDNNISETKSKGLATNKEVPQPNTTTTTPTSTATTTLTKTSSTESSTTTPPKQSPDALIANTTTTTTPVEPVHSSTRKVTEDNNISTETNSKSKDGKDQDDKKVQKDEQVVKDEKVEKVEKVEEVTTTKVDEVIEDVTNIDEDSSTKFEASIPEKTEEVTNGKEDGYDSNKDDKESDTGVSLHYESWQYNPISNRSGKKIYSIQFLKDVGTKIHMFDLHNESDDKIGLDGNQLQSAFSEKVDMFAPAFSSNSQRYTPTNRQNEPARRQSQHNYAGRSSAGQERQRKVISSASLTQEVELKTSSNPWRPTKDIKEDAVDDLAETESLKKKFRSILNKLTPNNFENLARTVTDLNIDTESKLGEVIDIVFAKALAEPGYCVLYGQMCSHLKKITAGTANFGNTLLKRCQNQFQSDIYSGLNLKERKDKIENEADAEVKKQLNEELYEEMYRCRMRGLGLIKFIGELYKIEMLNDAIMFDCVIRLLSDTSEESLECLCDLLATIGEKLDRSTQKNTDKEKKVTKGAPKANAYQGDKRSAAAVVAAGSTQTQQQKVAAEQATTLKTLDQVFEQLHKIRKNKDSALSARIKFKLLDTCELREKDNWLSKKTKDNNPKKIEEIREAHKEKLEQERRQVNTMGPRRSQEGRRLGHAGGSSSQLSSLANESGGNRGTSNMHTSSSSHLLRDHPISDNMKSNHNDIESQKEHQRKIESFRSLSVLKGIIPASKTSSNEALRPNSQIYQAALRPVTGIRSDLRPMGSSSASTGGSSTTTTAAAPSTNSSAALTGAAAQSTQQQQ